MDNSNRDNLNLTSDLTVRFSKTYFESDDAKKLDQIFMLNLLRCFLFLHKTQCCKGPFSDREKPRQPNIRPDGNTFFFFAPKANVSWSEWQLVHFLYSSHHEKRVGRKCKKPNFSPRFWQIQTFANEVKQGLLCTFKITFTFLKGCCKNFQNSYASKSTKFEDSFLNKIVSKKICYSNQVDHLLWLLAWKTGIFSFCEAMTTSFLK